MAHPRWRAYGLLLSGMGIVGLYVGFSKIILTVMPPALLATIRFAIAALVMLPWTFPRGGRAVMATQKGRIVLLSFFGNFLFSLSMLSGVARTSASSAGLIMSTLPAVVALFSVTVLKERMSLRVSLAIGLAVCAVATLSLRHGAGTSDRSLLGNLFMVVAVACEALYVVLGKSLVSANVGPMQISAWINAIGLVLMFPIGVWEARKFDFASVSAGLWCLIAAYALCASVLSTWLWLTGLRHVPASRAGFFTIALPVSSAAVGVVFLGESLGISHLIAFACATLGLILVTREPSPRWQ